MAHTPGQSSLRNEIDLDIPGVDDDAIPEDVLSTYSRFNPRRPRFYAERRNNPQTVFQTDLPDFSASQPPATHWSVAWSDLMMTMFVLFFTLYLARGENQQLIQPKTPESTAGTGSTEATADKPPVVTPQLTRIIRTAPSTMAREQAEEDHPVLLNPTAREEVQHPLQAPTNTTPATKESRRGRQYAEIDRQRSGAGPPATGYGSLPAPPQMTVEGSRFQEALNLGQSLLRENNLQDFASVKLLPDRALRLVLTGDLLFPSGLATLSAEAKRSLRKLTRLLERPGVQINIEGHTDNVPVHKGFSSNRQLSLARANAVADFLIDSLGIKPSQVVVSGFSSWRPLADNSSAAGRAANRRVEIILSRPTEAPVRGR